jgi:Zn-dependent protease with chaperone function
MVKQVTCPRCNSNLPVHDGFVTWCECGWNLEPAALEAPRTALERAYRQLGERSGQRLLEEMLEMRDLKPRWTLEKGLALALAGGVYALVVACFVAGGWLMLRVLMGDAFFVMAFPAVLLLGLGALGIPQPPKLERTPLSRTQHPALYHLLERVTRAAGGHRAPSLVVDSSFNATMGRYGWAQRPVMTLGLPLWNALEPQERVALLGHEIGHSVNGDNLRSWFFWGAVQALGQWQRVLHPDYLFATENPLYGLLRLPFLPVLYGLSGLAWLWLKALAILSFRDSQRAEYLADAVSAQSAGTRAALGLQWKILWRRTAEDVTQRITLERREDFFEVFAQTRAEVPTRELERLQRVSALEGTRLDHTHPQNAFRQRFLTRHRVDTPSVHLEPTDIQALEAEMLTLQRSVERELVSRHRDHMYSG